MKKISLIFLLFIHVIISSSQTAKVVGYFPSYRFDLYNFIDYCKLTHLNISFANPDPGGNLQIDNFSQIINSAKEQNPNIVICISLGGGALSENLMDNWSDLIDIPANRPAFITKILDFVETNNLDGVDFDLEWNAVTSGYSDFVKSLSDSLHQKGKLFTAALPGDYSNSNITNEALSIFDFINLMAYDETGPWNPNNPGQHSSYDFAVRSIAFWKNKGIAGSRLVLGVPFYGYDFADQNNVHAFTYAQKVNTSIFNADRDNSGLSYYNGRPTIEKKVELAANETSGIMIWEVGQDRFDEYSLLSTIHNKYTGLGFTTTGLCGNVVSAHKISKNNFEIYPNPASTILHIKVNSSEEVEISIYNLIGQKLNIFPQKLFNELVFNVSELQKGMYVVTIKNQNFNESYKIIIK